MKVIIIAHVGQLTYSYHSDGGIVFVARDLDHAKELASTDEAIEITDEEWSSRVEYELLDDDVNPKMFVFPDSGCC